MILDSRNALTNARRAAAAVNDFEIWNDVFMQYNKNEDGSYTPLKQKNVDTGMGIERTIAMLTGKKSVYETESFIPIIKKIEELSGKSYSSDAENKQGN